MFPGLMSLWRILYFWNNSRALHKSMPSLMISWRERDFFCRMYCSSGRQQFHPNEDVPADVVLVLDDLVILIADDVGVAPEVGRKIELSH